MREAVSENPESLDNRYNLACCLTAEGNYIESMDELLYIIERKKDFNDGIAKQAMLKIFTILGNRNPLTEKYRTKLSRLIF